MRTSLNPHRMTSPKRRDTPRRMLVVDPRDWLQEDGTLPVTNMRLRRAALRVARLIEYGGPLRALEMRETLVECSKRVAGHPCLGLIWVSKTKAGEIHAHCPACGTEEGVIHGWQETDWADGPMPPLDHKEWRAEETELH